jgi:RyR domain
VSGAASDGLVTSEKVSDTELEAMAAMEHESWMNHLQLNGWRYGPQRDDHRRIHPSLRPWNEVTPADQEKTESGETMRAEVGGWRITDDAGRSWSVASDIFASTYEHVEGDRWRRAGHALARPALGGEVINSLEGWQTAAEGDGVIKGPRGEEWLASSDHFAASYQISESGDQSPNSTVSPRAGASSSWPATSRFTADRNSDSGERKTR